MKIKSFVMGISFVAVLALFVYIVAFGPNGFETDCVATGVGTDSGGEWLGLDCENGANLKDRDPENIDAYHDGVRSFHCERARPIGAFCSPVGDSNGT
ncbi:MAG: hypothetical protein A3B23_01115 [Candidatus Colwellbacteria bacterium RIFCSPLOWO2_01_FULL_48_10]|uniref:Uncharacterized protein n=1 Tax=Candidatus Colwellbacteria bacterium RIFCSPLOWO2_01_FULL_48_10 TaxID=1797690 RepID=A0A1G1Z4F7_9BACT|nr:MAG: hypothetical protein A3B23_01115 [Candidatus Colwellbacteria bacterium RIFCSPLOWO2_01_FULL_48_10]